MSLDPSRIESIVSEVLDRLDRGHLGRDDARPLGVHDTLDQAVAAAREAFTAYQQTPLAVRYLGKTA